MKKLGVVLILWACTLPLSACAILETGPCYGTGCPVLHSSRTLQPPPKIPRRSQLRTARPPQPLRRKPRRSITTNSGFCNAFGRVLIYAVAASCSSSWCGLCAAITFSAISCGTKS